MSNLVFLVIGFLIGTVLLTVYRKIGKQINVHKKALITILVVLLAFLATMGYNTIHFSLQENYMYTGGALFCFVFLYYFSAETYRKIKRLSR